MNIHPTRVRDIVGYVIAMRDGDTLEQYAIAGETVDDEGRRPAINQRTGKLEWLDGDDDVYLAEDIDGFSGAMLELNDTVRACMPQPERIRALTERIRNRDRIMATAASL